MAGSNITTGSNNTAIGQNAQVPTATSSNQVRIGDTLVTYAGVQVAWTVTSDKRWKSDIIDTPLGLSFIRDLRPVDYFRTNDASKRRELGLIAQEVEQTLQKHHYKNGGIITKDDAGYLSLRYNDFFAPVIRAIQELAEKSDATEKAIEALRAENASLKEQNALFESRLQKLEREMMTR